MSTARDQAWSALALHPERTLAQLFADDPGRLTAGPVIGFAPRSFSTRSQRRSLETDCSFVR